MFSKQLHLLWAKIASARFVEVLLSEPGNSDQPMWSEQQAKSLVWLYSDNYLLCVVFRMPGPGYCRVNLIVGLTAAVV